MLKKHEYNGLLKHYTEEELVMVVSNLYNCLQKSVVIIDKIKKFQDNEIDEFDLLDELELLTIGDVGYAREYAYNASSVSDAINRVFRTLFGYALDKDNRDEGLVKVMDDNIMTLVDVYAGIKDEEAKRMNEIARAVASNAAYALKFEFSLQDTMQSYLKHDNNIELADVNAIMQQFCNRYSLNLIEEVEKILNLASIYKPVLPVFDAYPELEDSFERIVGPNLADVDPELLTLDIVMGVLQGIISPEELYTLFAETEEDAANG